MVFNVQKGWNALQQTLEGHTNGILAVAFSSDGKQLALASWDSIVRLWDVVIGTTLQALAGHTSDVT